MTDKTLDQADFVLATEKISSMEQQVQEERLLNDKIQIQMEERIACFSERIEQTEDLLKQKEGEVDVLTKKVTELEGKEQEQAENLKVQEDELATVKEQLRQYIDEVGNYQHTNIQLQQELQELEQMRSFNQELQIALAHQEKHL